VRRRYALVDILEPAPIEARERVVRVRRDSITLAVCGARIELPRSGEWIISGPVFMRLSKRSYLHRP